LILLIYELHNVYISPYITRIMKSRERERERSVGDVKSMGEFGAKTEAKRPPSYEGGLAAWSENCK